MLDRTKEPGAAGEPLYQDIVAALAEARADGLSPLRPTPRRRGPLRSLVEGVHSGDGQGRVRRNWPSRVRAITSRSASTMTSRGLSLPVDDAFEIESSEVRRPSSMVLAPMARWGPTRTRSRSSAKTTDLYVQGYFVYDSKKSGATTISHLRTSPRPIRSAYLVSQARFVACHQFELVDRIDVLEHAADEAVFLLNAPGPVEVWARLPQEVQNRHRQEHQVLRNRCHGGAREAGMGGRINTIMQTCFFAISGVLPPTGDPPDQAGD